MSMVSDPNGSLTPREEAFVDEFLVDFNGAQAAKRVGSKGSTSTALSVQANKVLSRDKVRKAIQERLAARATPSEVVLARLAEQALGNINDFIIWIEDDDTGEIVGMMPDIDEIARRGHLIKSITWQKYGPKIELYDAQKALITLANIFGAVTQRIDLTSAGEKIGITVIGGIDLDEDI